MEKMASRAGRLKERGKRGKHGSPEGEGEEERHALAKPRLVAVLRSKLRFTRFLQVPTGSHCLSSSPPTLQAVGIPTFPISLLSPSTEELTLSFFLSPSLQAVELPYFLLLYPSFFFTFSTYRQARISFFLSPSLQAVELPYFLLLYSSFFFTFSMYCQARIGFLSFPLYNRDTHKSLEVDIYENHQYLFRRFCL